MPRSEPDWISPLVHAEVERLRLNGEARAHFNETVKRIDDESDAAEIRRVIADCWGVRTYMIAVERG